MKRLLPLAALLVLLPSAFAAKPSQRRPTDMERGKELYLLHCVACHGAKNHGDGPATEALVADVPDLVGKVKADDATAQLLLQGRGAMPSYEASFDAKDAKRVLKYMIEAHVKGDEKKPAPEAAPDAEAPEDALDGQAPEGPEAPEVE